MVRASLRASHRAPPRVLALSEATAPYAMRVPDLPAEMHRFSRVGAPSCPIVKQTMPDSSGIARAPHIMEAVALTADERTVCACLRSEMAVVTPSVLAAARRHRVHRLLHDRPSLTFSDPLIEAALKREVLHAAALDVREEEETRALLDALSTDAIAAMVFKGAALAHVIYSAPYLRPRTDIDILIRAEAVEAAGCVLERCGWTRLPEPALDESAAQRHYEKPGPGRTTWLVDLHWRISNPRIFGEAVQFGDFRSRAMRLPALGSAALGPSRADGLLIACMHRVAHHEDDIDLLWLWDVHLLVETLAEGERALFAQLAQRAAMTAVCRRGIGLCADLFGTRSARDVLDRLTPSAPERSERFVGGVRPVAVFASDLAAITGVHACVSSTNICSRPSPTCVSESAVALRSGAAGLRGADRSRQPKWWRPVGVTTDAGVGLREP